MKNSILLTLIFLSSYFNPLFAKVKNEFSEKEIQQMIENVEGESGEKLSIINFHLRTKALYKHLSIVPHETFLQIKLKDTIVVDPGKFYDINSPYFKKVVIFQTSSNEALIRIITLKNPEKIALATSIDSLNKRIIVTANHSMIEKQLSKEKNSENIIPSKDINIQKTTSQDFSLTESNEVRDSSKDTQKIASQPSNISDQKISNEINNDTLNLKPSNDLSDQMRTIAIFSLAMIILLLGSLTVRRLHRNRSFLRNSGYQIPMKALNNLVLTPKHKLTLVQVGQDKLLLSISPDGISLLTHINEKSPFIPKTDNHNNNWTSNEINKMKELRGRTSHSKNQFKETNLMTTKKMQPVAHESPSKSELQKTIVQDKPSSSSQNKSINYAIDDNGIRKESITQKEPESTEKAIEDVTKLIREKLRSLPKIQS